MFLVVILFANIQHCNETSKCSFKHFPAQFFSFACCHAPHSMLKCLVAYLEEGSEFENRYYYFTGHSRSAGRHSGRSLFLRAPHAGEAGTAECAAAGQQTAFRDHGRRQEAP